MTAESDLSTLIPEVTPAVILVCDDDGDTRAVVTYAVEALGHKVIEAADGLAAQEACKQALPDAMIMDIMMPRLTGTEFVRWFRHEYPGRFVPILFLSALSEVEHRVEGFIVGGDDYLTKPFHGRELQARVQALLRIRLLTERLSARTRELEQANSELVQAQASLVARERELTAMQLAGAAAHGARQPLTSILLHCRLLEMALKDTSLEPGGAKRFTDGIAGIRRECEAIEATLAALRAADPEATTEYLREMKILDLSSSASSPGKKTKC